MLDKSQSKWTCFWAAGGLFDFSKLHAVPKVVKWTRQEILYTSDKCNSPLWDLQQLLDHFLASATGLGLMNSSKIIEVILTCPRRMNSALSISTSRSELQCVDDFIYLHSVLDNCVSIDGEIAILSKIKLVFWMWETSEQGVSTASSSPSNKEHTKLSCLPCCCWGARLGHCLEGHQLMDAKCIRCTFMPDAMRWWNNLNNNEDLQHATGTAIEVLMTEIQLWWAGHMPWVNNIKISQQLWLEYNLLPIPWSSNL